MSMRITVSTLLLCVPLLTQAQAYKCKQPGGSVTFQDQPCAAGATSSNLALPPPTEPRAPAPALAQPTTVSRDPRTGRTNQETNDELQRLKAQEQQQRCQSARNQLGILREARPVYRRDKNGERQYVEDENRPAEIAAAERRVSAECRR